MELPFGVLRLEMLNMTDVYGWSWKLAPTPSCSSLILMPAAWSTDLGPIDKYVRATLEAIVAAPDQFPSDVDARLGLYRVFQVIWGSTHDDREEADSFDAYPDADDDSRRLLAEQRLRADRTRRAEARASMRGTSTQPPR